ncbi:hypothetical protein ACFXTN_029594 [Malus domestica]
MSKAGYDFASSSNPGKKVSNTINNKERDLTETQKKLKKHGYGVNNNKAGLGFAPNAPMKISIFDRMNRSRPGTETTLKEEKLDMLAEKCDI